MLPCVSLRRMMVVTFYRSMTTALFCLEFWCSSISGSNIAVLVRNPVATSSEPTIITVYRDDAGRSVVFDKAVLEGGNINNQFLQFRDNSPRIPDNAMSNSDSEPATLTLPVTMTTAQRHGIYSITVTEDDGEETILRVLVTNEDASVTAAEYSTIVSKGEQVTLMAVLTSGIQTNSLRWRRDGRFEHLPSTEYSVAMAESSSVLECFVAGDYTQNLHAVMNLITRGCPLNTAGLDCELPCPRCFNGGVCSDKTASCLCPPGFGGIYCERVHGRNIFGQYAEYKCTDTADDHDDGCQGAIICYPEPLGCICPAGYMGIDCMTECVEGKFGANCKQDCHCPDNVVCAKDTGVCENNVCAEGWKGVNCQIPAAEACPVGLYGNECTLQCSCPVRPCPGVQSNCDMGCASPWTGEMCSEDSGKGRITMLDYVKVNPDVSTTVTCSAVRNPVLEEGDLQLLGLEGTLVLSSVSGAGDKTYIRTNTWMVTLQSDPVLMASCSIRRTSISQSILLMPYELLRYSDDLSIPSLFFSSVTSSSILVSWLPWQDGRDVGDGPIKEYVIQYGEEGEDFIEAARTANTLHHFMDLKVDTLYRFRVVLVREGINGDGPPNDVGTQRTLCGDPTSPDLALVSRTSRTATFRTEIPPRDGWSCSSITASLQRQQPDGQWIEEQTLSSSSETVVVRNLIPCSSYTFRVQIDNSQASAESQPVDVTTQPEALVVRDIWVTSVTVGQLDVSWSPPETSQTNCVLSTYNVMYCLVRHLACTSDVTESMYNSSTTSSTSRTLRGLSDYAEYEVKVRADGEVEGMEIIEIGTTLPAAPSAAPANIMLANISSTCLIFTWKPPPCNQRNGEIMAYQYLLFLTNGTANDTVVTNSSTADEGIELCGLIPYSEYYFKVRALTSVGQGPDSEIITTRTEEDVPPQLDPPRFLFTNASSLQFQWQAPYPPHGIITGYNISVQLIDENQSNMSFIVSVDVENAGEPPSFIVTDLEPFRNYSIMVRANTRIGPGNWSLAVISKANEVPSPPRNLKVFNISKFSLTIEWDIPEQPAGDIIRYENS